MSTQVLSLSTKVFVFTYSCYLDYTFFERNVALFLLASQTTYFFKYTYSKDNYAFVESFCDIIKR